MSENDKKKTLSKAQMVEVKVTWAPADELETIYVNHLKVTHMGPEFYLMFGELPMPSMLEGEEFPSELEIIPKVRLAISPEQMGSIADVIYDNCQKYLKRKNDDSSD